jgi:hypothetical protein
MKLQVGGTMILKTTYNTVTLQVGGTMILKTTFNTAGGQNHEPKNNQ